MHPYVYKKHHKPYQLLAVVILSYIMILSQPVDSCPNFPVKKIRVFSEFSKGFVRIEGTKVIASKCEHSDWENFNLYKVTIDKHYMLLYHIKTGKFICWNKSYKKLVAKRNPANLTYCKFEDRPSASKAYQGSHIRYTTNTDKGRQIEIRFTKTGAFAKPRFIERCVGKKLKHPLRVLQALKLNPGSITEESKEEMDAYKFLMKHCASPDFIPDDVKECKSGLGDFCTQMKDLTNNGHSISSEIKGFCKNEWYKNN